MPETPMLSRPIPSTGELMHLAGVRCRRRRKRAAAAARSRSPAARCGREDDRQLADVRPGGGGDRRSARRFAGEAARLSRDQGVDDGPRARHRANAALGGAAAQRGHRFDADPQPRRLAHPSGDVAADEGGGRHPLYRHHPLHRPGAFRARPYPRNRARIDFVQCGYSLATRAAERELLPVAAARGVAVIVNQPLGQGGLLRRVRGQVLPDWAREFDCTSWARLLLKYVLAEPTVTCVIPATRNPEHMEDNIGAGFGRLPDREQCQRIRALWDAV